MPGPHKFVARRVHKSALRRPANRRRPSANVAKARILDDLLSARAPKASQASGVTRPAPRPPAHHSLGSIPPSRNVEAGVPASACGGLVTPYALVQGALTAGIAWQGNDGRHSLPYNGA